MRLSGLAAASLAVLLSASTGCDRAPTSPNPPITPIPIDYTLSGTVFGLTSFALTPTGHVPVADVLVQASGFPAVRTDASGHYQIAGLHSGVTTTITASKTGYATNGQGVKINGDTTLDIDLTGVGPFSLFGSVSELTPGGPVAAQGIVIEVMSCPLSPGNCAGYLDLTATLDRDGHYRFSGLYAGKDNWVWVLRNGQYYDDGAGPSCDGCYRPLNLVRDTQLDIQLPPTDRAFDLRKAVIGVR